MSPRRAALAAAIGLPLAFLALIFVEFVLVSRREFLSSDPGYSVEGTLDPAGGAGGGPLELAVLGDSTVAGVGSPIEAESLPVLIAQRTADLVGRPVHVVGFGVPGARTATLISVQLPMIEAGQFDAIVLVIGSNDATHATPWWELREQTAAMLEQATQLGAPVVLAGTPRFSGTEIIPQPLRWMVDAYSGVLRRQQVAAVEAAPDARFVDIAADASPRFEGVPEATSSDGFHPSPIGYGFWADAVALSVAEAAQPSSRR